MLSDMVQSALEAVEAPLAEVRFEKRSSVVVRAFLPGEATRAEIRTSVSFDQGAAARVWVRGRVGFAASPWSPEEGVVGLRKLLRNAAVNGVTHGQRDGLTRGGDPVAVRPADELTAEAVIACIAEASERMRGLVKAIGSTVPTSLVLREVWCRRVIATNQGRLVEALDRRYSLDVTIHTRSGTWNRGLGRSDRPVSVEVAAATAEDLLRRATLRNRQAIAPGRETVILDPELTGLFVHEVLGHQAEADVLLRPDGTADWLIPGRQVASHLVSVYDDPGLAGMFGSYQYDDEATPGSRVCILEAGRFCGLLHSRSTAHWCGSLPTGHARAVSWRHPPLVRMSNTYLAPGTACAEEVMNVRRGLYLRGARGGSAGPPFCITSQDGWWVEDGRLKQPVGPVTVTGDLREVLMGIDCVGTDFAVFGGGEGGCGKGGQFPLPVAAGGPSIRLSRAVVRP